MVKVKLLMYSAEMQKYLTDEENSEYTVPVELARILVSKKLAIYAE